MLIIINIILLRANHKLLMYFFFQADDGIRFRSPSRGLGDVYMRQVEVHRRPGDEAILSQGKVDWLGFNYYQPTRVQAPDSKFDENGLPCISKPYIWPERKMNVYRGWEIYPKGIYDFGMKIKKECPDLPFFISENGMGVEGEEKYMDENGKFSLEKADPIAYSHGTYYTLGEKLGTFGYSVKKR